MASVREKPEPIGIVPRALFVAGVAMTVANVWTTFNDAYQFTFYLVWGGPFAVAGAAMLGRRAALSMKQIVVMVLACSILGNVANWGARSLVEPSVHGYVSASGEAAGSIAACLVAYFIGMLVRRGARARRDEKIGEIFG